MKKMIQLLLGIFLLTGFVSSSFGQQVDANKKTPCENSAKHRQLDFWIGEWDVFNAQNQKAGTNVIKKIQNGCALQENWTSNSGSTGTSINLYNPGTNKWEQHWVAASGYIIWYPWRVQRWRNAFHPR